MIKNKTLDIKIIFKTYSKILKIGYKYFRFPNNFFFYKTNFIVIFQSCFKKQLSNKS